MKQQQRPGRVRRIAGRILFWLAMLMPLDFGLGVWNAVQTIELHQRIQSSRVLMRAVGTDLAEPTLSGLVVEKAIFSTFWFFVFLVAARLVGGPRGTVPPEDAADLDSRGQATSSPTTAAAPDNSTDAPSSDADTAAAWTCETCGTGLLSTDRFCARCGRERPIESEPEGTVLGWVAAAVVVGGIMITPFLLSGPQAASSAPATEPADPTILPEPGQSTRFLDDVHGCVIDFPPGWRLTGGGSQASIVERAVLHGVPAFSQIAELILHIEEFESLDIQGVLAIQPSELAARLERESGARVSLMDHRRTQVNGNPAVRVHFKVAEDSHVMEYVIPRGDRIYTLFVSATSLDDAWWQQVEAAATKSIGTMRFLGPPKRAAVEGAADVNPLLSAIPFRCGQHGFEIHFPKGWVERQTAVPGTIVKCRRDCKQIAMLTIAAHDLGEPLDISVLNDELALRASGIPSIGSTVLHSGMATVAGQPARLLKVRTDKPHLARGISRNYLFMKGNILFRVSTMTDPDEAWFQANEPLFSASINSLRFLQD